MKIKKSVLERIIKEELRAHIVELLEADAKPDKPDPDKEKKGEEKPDPAKKATPPAPEPKKEPAKKPDGPPAPPEATSDAAPEEKPIEQDPADADLEKDEPPEDVDSAQSKLRDQLTGKTIQSISREPKSKILPGAQEIVVTFDQVQDPLRILVTKVGDVKFYYRGLHNEI